MNKVCNKPREATEIFPHLYLGSVNNAKEAIQKGDGCPYTRILNVGRELPDLSDKARASCPGLSYRKEVVLYRDYSSKLTIGKQALQTFSACVEFIHETLGEGKEPGRCLVHCARGRTRSTAVVLAYMILHHRWTLKRCFLYCKKRRPYIGPGSPLRPQLVALELEVLGSNSLTLGSWRKLDNALWGNPETLDEEEKEIEKEAVDLHKEEESAQTRDREADAGARARRGAQKSPSSVAEGKSQEEALQAPVDT